jgi:cytochrome c biogenesis protein
MTAQPASGGITDALWKLFASIKLTLVLLLSLAVTSIIGTLIPQNAEPAAYVAAYGETLFRFFWVLGLFDMYHSWWFQILIILLAANVVVCSVDRISSNRKILLVRRPHFQAARFRNLPDSRTPARRPHCRHCMHRIFPGRPGRFRWSRARTGS